MPEDHESITTEQLSRELEAVRDLFNHRFLAYDKAIDLLQKQADKSPSIAEVDLSVKHLKELMEALFESVGQKFEGNAIALAAAFAAAKEAVSEQQKSNTTAISKSETWTSEQLKLLQAQWQNSSSASNSKIDDQGVAINSKIDDLKTRISIIEATKAGGNEERYSHKQSNAFIVTVVIAAVAMSGLLINGINTWSSLQRVESSAPSQNGR